MVVVYYTVQLFLCNFYVGGLNLLCDKKKYPAHKSDAANVF